MIVVSGFFRPRCSGPVSDFVLRLANVQKRKEPSDADTTQSCFSG